MDDLPDSGPFFGVKTAYNGFFRLHQIPPFFVGTDYAEYGKSFPCGIEKFWEKKGFASPFLDKVGVFVIMITGNYRQKMHPVACCEEENQGQGFGSFYRQRTTIFSVDAEWI